MSEFNISGAGLVVPAGTLPPTGVLPEGELKVTIQRVDPENGYDAQGKEIASDYAMAQCLYPDGFAKSHQAKTIADLLTKVAGQMKGRYGMKVVEFTATPSVIEAGATITISKE